MDKQKLNEVADRAGSAAARKGGPAAGCEPAGIRGAGMKFGVNTFIWAATVDEDLLNFLPSIRQHGFDGVELPLIRPAKLPVAGIRRSIEADQLACTFCSVLPGDLNVLSEEAAIRQKTQGHLMDCVRVAAEAGAKLIAGPLYSPVGYLPGRRRTDDEWKRAVECYQALGDTLTSYGVTIALEPLNRFETYFLNTADDGARLVAEIDHPNVGMLFDTFHANIEEKDIAGSLRPVAAFVKHFHASETTAVSRAPGIPTGKAFFKLCKTYATKAG